MTSYTSSALTNETENVEWVLVQIQGSQYRKTKSVQIGNETFICKNTIERNHNKQNTANLPRSWLRMLSTHLMLKQLQASDAQLNHHLHICGRNLFDDEPRHFLHLLNDGQFGIQQREKLQKTDIQMIENQLQLELHSRENENQSKFKSLADTSNRKRDFARVQRTLYLPELGFDGCTIDFFIRDTNALLAHNYQRIVYGDHGPYIEFNADQIEWSSFSTQICKGDIAYYDEFYANESDIKLYAQKKTVHDQPNPPLGKYSENRNRAIGEGYADYIIGLFYIACDEAQLMIKFHDNHISPFLYLLTKNELKDDHRKHASFRKFNRNHSNWNKNNNINNNSKKVQAKGSTIASVLRKNIVIERNPPQIKTREGKRVLKSCLEETYIPGLIYISDFITKEEEKKLRDSIIIKQTLIANQCDIQQKRRSLQFGWHLDYQTMELYRSKSPELREIPGDWQWIANRIKEYYESRNGSGRMNAFNQLILNEYSATQGISDHTDRTHVFGPIIAGISLFSSCVLDFRLRSKHGQPAVHRPVLVLPRSLYIMTGECRYDWLHGISKDREQKFCGHMIRRGLRYSMTFRHAFGTGSEVLSRSSYNEISGNAMDI